MAISTHSIDAAAYRSVTDASESVWLESMATPAGVAKTLTDTC